MLFIDATLEQELHAHACGCPISSDKEEFVENSS